MCVCLNNKPRVINSEGRINGKSGSWDEPFPRIRIYIYIDKGALCRNTIKLRAPLIVSRPLASREFVGIGDRREETDKAEFTRGADGPRRGLAGPPCLHARLEREI